MASIFPSTSAAVTSLGSSPTQTARLLIGETSMALSEIAFVAGFGSIRQFNESMRTAFGCNPTDLRRRMEPVPAARGEITLRLSHRLPFDAGSLLTYLGRRAVPGVEQVVDGRYRRTVALGRSVDAIELEPIAGNAVVRLRLRLDELGDLALVVQRCRGLLDLDVDPAAVSEVLGADPVLAPLDSACPVWWMAGKSPSGPSSASRSRSRPRTLAGRLAAALGAPLAEPDRHLTHLFPRPEAVAEADLSSLGITRARGNTLRGLAGAVLRGEIMLDRGADREDVETCLLGLPGIGPRTASYIAMRALGDPDAFLPGDLGVRRAAEQLGLDPSPRRLEAYAERWRPWRAYAVLYLWKSLAAETDILSREV